MRSEHFLNPSNLFDDMKEEQGGRREGRGCGREEKRGRRGEGGKGDMTLIHPLWGLQGKLIFSCRVGEFR